MRILAVDDEPFIRELLPKFAARAGFENVETADSGAAALRCIAESTAGYDCFLLDISMPDMDGISLCRQIRALPDHARTPIIMLTAMVDHSFITEAFTAGATDYATKPFDLSDLGNRLRAAKTANLAYERAIGAPPRPGTGTPAAPAPTCGAVDAVPHTRFLDPATFRNYLAQMSRDRLSLSQVFAVTVPDVAALRPATATGHDAEVLTLICAVLNDGLSAASPFMTQTGTGMLLVVSDRDGFATPQAFAADLAFALTDRCHRAGRTPPAPIKVTVGKPVRLSADNVADVDALFAQAEFLAQQQASPTAPRSGGGGALDFLRRTLQPLGWRGK